MMFTCANVTAPAHSGAPVEWTIVNNATGESRSVQLCGSCSGPMLHLAALGRPGINRRPKGRPRGTAGLAALIHLGTREEAPKPTM